MKRLLALIAALALFALCASAAGNETIYNAQDNHDGYVGYYAKCGDYVYALTVDGKKLLRWRADEGMTEIPLAEGLLESEQYFAELRAFVSDGEDMRVLCAYMDIEDNYNFAEALMWRVDFSGRIANFVEPVEMDWDDMIEYYDTNEYTREMKSPAIISGKLVFSTYIGGEDAMGSYDIVTGEGELFEAPASVTGVCAYSDSAALVLTAKYADPNTEIALYLFDVNTGEFTRVGGYAAPNYDRPTGLAYDANQDIVYFARSGELFAVRNFDMQNAVAVSSISQRGGWGSAPVILDDGRYLAADSNSVYIRDTNPEARNADKLVVFSNYIRPVENAQTNFATAHPDTDVVLMNSFGDISDAMLARDSSVDIYVVEMSGMDYAAMYERGYLAEFPYSEKLDEYASNAYPGVKSRIYKDGELVALPIYIYADCWQYNVSAFAELGFSEADLPTSWQEFIPFIAELPKYLAGHDDIFFSDAYLTQEGARRTLFNGLFRTYIRYMQCDPAAAQTFDNAEFAEMIEALMRIDFAALGLSEDYDDDMGYEGDYRELFVNYSDLYPSAYTLNSGFRAMPMSMFAGGAPYIGASVTAAIINPYSENRALAAEYLEYACDYIDPVHAAAISTARDKPVKNESFEQAAEKMLAQIDMIESEIAKCTDEDELEDWNELLENRLARYEEYRAFYEYMITEESLAFFKPYGEMIVVDSSSALYAQDNYQEVDAQINQFFEGGISASEMLKNIDRKYQMMILEGM